MLIFVTKLWPKANVTWDDGCFQLSLVSFTVPFPKPNALSCFNIKCY